MAKITEIKPTHKLFTYSVNMLVHVFAENEAESKEKLDKEGGFVSKREASLVATARLHNEFPE
jgi:hypothetical protein